MSDQDAQADKLVASIRKTRSTAAKSSVKKSAVKKKQTVATTPAPAKPAVKATKKKSVAKSSVTNKEQKKQLVGLFQKGRRVWPD